MQDIEDDCNTENEEKKNKGKRWWKQEFLPADELADCIHRYQQTGDIEARNKIVVSHLRLAKGRAHSFLVAAGFGPRNQHGDGVGDYQKRRDALIVEASIAIGEAARTFDSARGVKFQAYAWRAIVNRLQDVGKKESRGGIVGAPKGAVVSHVDLTIHPRNEMSGSDDAGYEWIATRSDHPLSASFGDTGSRFMGGQEESVPIMDLQSCETPEGIFAARDAEERDKQAVALAVEGLSERERIIFNARQWTDNRHGLKELAKELGLSSERVRQIEHAAVSKVRANANEKRVSIRSDRKDRTAYPCAFGSRGTYSEYLTGCRNLSPETAADIVSGNVDLAPTQFGLPSHDMLSPAQARLTDIERQIHSVIRARNANSTLQSRIQMLSEQFGCTFDRMRQRSVWVCLKLIRTRTAAVRPDPALAPLKVAA